MFLFRICFAYISQKKKRICFCDLTDFGWEKTADFVLKKINEKKTEWKCTILKIVDCLIIFLPQSHSLCVYVNFCIIIVIVGASIAACQSFTVETSTKADKNKLRYSDVAGGWGSSATAHWVHRQKENDDEEENDDDDVDEGKREARKSYSIIFNKTKIRYNNTDGITIK